MADDSTEMRLNFRILPKPDEETCGPSPKLYLAQSNICMSSVSCYTALLRLVGEDKHNITTDLIRNFFNINNALLQQLRIYERELTEYQRQYLVHQKNLSHLEKEIDFYRNSENSLLIAVEGMEVKRSQNASKSIQIILFVFTALSVYSAASDILTFISNEGEMLISLFSIRTIIFIGITLVLACIALPIISKIRKV